MFCVIHLAVLENNINFRYLRSFCITFCLGLKKRQHNTAKIGLEDGNQISRTNNTAVSTIKMGSVGVVDTRNSPFVKMLTRNSQQQNDEGARIMKKKIPKKGLTLLMTSKNAKCNFF